MADTWAKDVADFEKHLQRCIYKVQQQYLGGKSPARYGNAGYGDALVDALVMVAETGRGPGGSTYPAYSAKYAARKQKAGNMRWLRGINNIGNRGGMLDKRRFSFEIRGAQGQSLKAARWTQGTLYLVWTSDGSKEMDVYADLHNTGGPKLPARPWMHLESPEAENAVTAGLEAAWEELIAQFNSGNVPE